MTIIANCLLYLGICDTHVCKVQSDVIQSCFNMCTSDESKLNHFSNQIITIYNLAIHLKFAVLV